MLRIETATSRLWGLRAEQAELVLRDGPAEQALLIWQRERVLQGVLTQLHVLVGSKRLHNHFGLNTVGHERDRANLLNPQTMRDCLRYKPPNSCRYQRCAGWVKSNRQDHSLYRILEIALNSPCMA